MRIFNEDFTKELTESEADQTRGRLHLSEITKNVEKDGVITQEVEAVYIYRVFTEEQLKEDLRYKRENQCFEIINRGEIFWEYLWAKFTADEVASKKQEVLDWYKAWLDVTETKIIPDRPSWL